MWTAKFFSINFEKKMYLTQTAGHLLNTQTSTFLANFLQSSLYKSHARRDH